MFSFFFNFRHLIDDFIELRGEVNIKVDILKKIDRRAGIPYVYCVHSRESSLKVTYEKVSVKNPKSHPGDWDRCLKIPTAFQFSNGKSWLSITINY